MMRTKLLSAVAFLAATLVAAPVSAQVSLGTPSGLLGPTQSYTTTRGTVIVSGFNGTTPINLYGKNSGGDEVGVGLSNDTTGQNEIQSTASDFVQLDVSGLSAGTLLSFLMGSTTAGEGWQVLATNTADCYMCGTLAATGTDEGVWHSLGVPTTTYFDFYAVGTSLGAPSNVLLGSLNVSAVPEPAAWVMMLLGFGAIGMAARRSRRKVALAQLA